MARILLTGVAKRYPDGTEAVRDASFEVHDGEFFILVGPSGCGKSTLVHLIAGLEAPTRGEIRIGDRRVNELDARQRNVALVFQSYALYPHMSVRRNIAFPLELAGHGRDEIRRRVEAIARTLGLAGQLERRPAQLSGGQRQRVAMGRALVREPDAFLLDEPLSNLDAALRVQMRTELARLQRRLGTTTVYVTHDQTEAMTLGNRIAVLRDGSIEQLGTPRELYAEPANRFVAGFLGAPPMNFLPVRPVGDRLELGIAALPREALGVALADRGGRALVAGVRPEHLQEVSAEEAHAARGAGPVFRVRVDVLEWLGSELYAWFECGESGAASAVARLSPESPAREGGDLWLRLDPERFHLFDAETGARVARAPDLGGTPGCQRKV